MSLKSRMRRWSRALPTPGVRQCRDNTACVSFSLFHHSFHFTCLVFPYSSLLFIPQPPLKLSSLHAQLFLSLFASRLPSGKDFTAHYLPVCPHLRCHPSILFFYPTFYSSVSIQQWVQEPLYSLSMIALILSQPECVF